MDEEEKIPTSRDKYVGKLKERFPDKQFADDEEIFGQALADGDEYSRKDEELKGLNDFNEELKGLMDKDPRSAAFLSAWRSGENPVVALIRMFGPELKEMMDDPEFAEAIEAASKEYFDRVNKEKEFEEEYAKNAQQTLDMLDQQLQEGVSEEEQDKAIALLYGVLQDGLMGIIKRESIDMALKALNHDSDVETAGYEGEVRGRNAKISEKLKKQGQTDGTANLQGKNGGAPKQQQNGIFDLAMQAR